MADNITITSGANSTPPANTVIATDDVGSVHYQAVKIALGADGAVDNLVDSGQQLSAVSVPVVLASDQSAVSTTVGGTVTVDATGQGDVPITLDGETITIGAALPAGANNIGDVDILTVPAPLSTTGGGTEAAALRVTVATDSTGVLSVDDNGSSLTIDGTVTASNAAGDVAHDAVDSGNPLKIGGKAKEEDGSDPGSVAENDRVDAIYDRQGRQFVNTASPFGWSANANYSTPQTDGTVKAAPGAGYALHITDVILTTDTAINIKLEDEDGGTIVPPLYFADNGGAAMHYRTPIRMTANKALTLTSSGTANHSVMINGYTAP